jgi:uncharacterized protein
MSQAPTPRTRIGRVPKRAVYDRPAIEAILDEGLVCHLAFVHLGQPFCIPTIHARDGDTVYLHGSAASRMVRTLTSGARRRASRSPTSTGSCSPAPRSTTR